MLSTHEEGFPAPELELRPVGEWWLGCPLLLALTLTNRVVGALYHDVPVPGYLDGPLSLDLTLAGERETCWSHSAGALPEPAGLTLRAGASRQVLTDLSEANPRLAAGTYNLSVRQRGLGWVTETKECRVLVREPAPRDLAFARACHGQGGGSWKGWLGSATARPTDEQIEQVSTEVQGALALHLYLQRVIHDVYPIAELDPALLPESGDPTLELELAVLRHEILTAQKRGNAHGLRHAVEERSPGLVWRLDENEAGRGVMARMRREVGAERRCTRATYPSAPARHM